MDLGQTMMKLNGNTNAHGVGLHGLDIRNGFNVVVRGAVFASLSTTWLYEVLCNNTLIFYPNDIQRRKIG